MRYQYDIDEDEDVRGRRKKRGSGSGTEITLGTRSLLGIFFGLVLICGIFFGLGYSVGRVGSAKATLTESPTDAPGPTTDSSLQKPSAGQLTLTPAAATTAPDNGGPTSPPAPNPQNTAAAPPPTAPGSVEESAAPNPATNVVVPLARQTQAPAATLTPVAVTQPAAAPGSFMVQIAAVRLQTDAQILVSALKTHGYNAVVRNEPQDTLLHVQLGPFSTRADAMAMRSRLLAAGYNAVVK